MLIIYYYVIDFLLFNYLLLLLYNNFYLNVLSLSPKMLLDVHSVSTTLLLICIPEIKGNKSII